MPDRYGEPTPEPVVDFDSRRQARENAATAARAEQQRRRLADTRTVHTPLTPDQSAAARTHRQNTTAHAQTHRNIDHRPAAARGMDLVREALAKDRRR